MFGEEIWRVVSSAKSNTKSNLEELARSFMSKKNSNGPRTDPCGMPQFISLKDDDVSLKVIYCFLLDR